MMIVDLEDKAIFIASMVCGRIPSSIAITSIIISVADAPIFIYIKKKLLLLL
jgi:hypothetical protein